MRVGDTVVWESYGETRTGNIEHIEGTVAVVRRSTGPMAGKVLVIFLSSLRAT